MHWVRRTQDASAAMGGSNWVARLVALVALSLVLGSVDASLGDVDPNYR
jgi:post-GPI attachment to proteins factor 3